MKLPANLRLALVPIGLLIATKGLSYLSDEHDRLSKEIDRQRAELAAADPTAPEDFPPAHLLEDGPGGKFAAAQPARRRRRAGTIAAAAAGFAAGAYLATRAHQYLMERAADEIAAGVGDVDHFPPAPAAAVPLVCRDCKKPFPGDSTFPGPRCVDCWIGPDDTDSAKPEPGQVG